MPAVPHRYYKGWNDFKNWFKSSSTWIYFYNRIILYQLSYMFFKYLIYINCEWTPKNLRISNCTKKSGMRYTIPKTQSWSWWAMCKGLKAESKVHIMWYLIKPEIKRDKAAM